MKNLSLLLVYTLLVSYVSGETYSTTGFSSQTAKEEFHQPIKKTKKKRKKRRQTKTVENSAIDNKISISEENQPTSKKKRK